MKATKYFVSNHRDHSDLHKAISEAEERKNDYLKNNISIIEEIEKEELKIVVTGHNNSLVYAVVELCYYSKNSDR